MRFDKLKTFINYNTSSTQHI